MRLKVYVSCLRPKQWLKNLMVFFPPLLSGAFFPATMIAVGSIPFIAFCFASSASYVFNDLIDRNQDIKHPAKSSRPIASGQIPPFIGSVYCGFLALCALLLSIKGSPYFWAYVGGYLLLFLFYSLYFKNIPILDVFCVATGFVFRLYAGGEAFGVVISDWLFLSVFLLAIFLSFGKRLSEQKLLGQNAGNHRRILKDYPQRFLESALYLSGATVLVTYSMYAITRPLLVYTVPLCMFGLLRYLMRIQKGENGDPTESLLNDIPLLLTGTAWFFIMVWSIYK